MNPAPPITAAIISYSSALLDVPGATIVSSPALHGSASQMRSPPSGNSVAQNNKFAFIGLGVLIAYALARSLFAAASRPLWCDEIATLLMARMHTISAIWNALARGVDGQPPPFDFIEHAAGALAPPAEIAFRLPSIFAFACVLLCVFIFVRRRSDGVIALVCAAILLLTGAFDYYAIEARPYSMLVACIAFALVCYQRSDETRWVILMGLSLVAAESMHYYAVFAFVPFGIAEIALSLKTHRLRAGVWLAMGCGLLPLAIFWPLLLDLKRNYGRNYWARPTLRRVGGFYGWLFHSGSFYVNFSLAALVVFLLFGALLLLALPKTRKAWMANPFFQEQVLIVGLLGLPFVTYVVIKVVHGGMDYRYVLPAVLAIPLGAGFLLPRFNRTTVAVAAIGMFCVFAVKETRFWGSQRGHLGHVVSPAAPIEHLVEVAGRPDLPVAFTDQMDYPKVEYYADPGWAERFVYIADPPGALAHIGTDNFDEWVLVVGSIYPFPVYEFHAFVHDHPAFLLYSNGGYPDWWPGRLRDDGYSLQVLAADKVGTVYLVTRPGVSP
ncbi:MAG: glycosyltransferase family 39 protein [Candidatus Acidiferrales bacterium]